MNELLLYLYVLPLAAVGWLYVLVRRHREARDASIWREAVESGQLEPPGLHPVVDARLCMGAGACIDACPERAIGFMNGKAQLVNPAACIGYGDCAVVCPVGAIKLVFGTERRGVDIPYVKTTLETNVAGVFIAGELGGMGLIHKAVEQGKTAIESIRQRRAEGEELDVVIIGAGPAGFSATLAAMHHKLKFVTLEQESSFGGTVYHYPRNKVVMTKPFDLPMVGVVKLGEISKEALLELWQDIAKRVGMPVLYEHRVDKVGRLGDSFEVVTPRAKYRAKSVLLAIGRRGTPRKLGVPGEDQAKVVYSLVDAEQYRGQNVLVVGGGDTAVEAALSVAAQPGTRVTLSYRGDAFARVKPKNHQRLKAAQQSGAITVVLRSTVSHITEHAVTLEHDSRFMTLKNDAVIICAGGVLPMPMLLELGVTVETKFGTA